MAAQADVLSQGFEHLISRRGDNIKNRSRSVDGDQRTGATGVHNTDPATDTTPVKRERSLQDIDKDIETIWRELQQLDKSK